jgi:hypothetical protein
MSWKTIMVLAIVVLSAFAFSVLKIPVPPYVASLLAAVAAAILAEMRSSGLVRAATGALAGKPDPVQRLEYGDGSDGAGHIVEPTTLTRDMNYSSLRVSAPLTTGGFRVTCQTPITIEQGGSVQRARAKGTVEEDKGSGKVGES